jgi:hypothetical protein
MITAISKERVIEKSKKIIGQFLVQILKKKHWIKEIQYKMKLLTKLKIRLQQNLEKKKDTMMELVYSWESQRLDLLDLLKSSKKNSKILKFSLGYITKFDE